MQCHNMMQKTITRNNLCGLVLITSLLLCSCKQVELYERLVNIPEAKWQRSFVPTYKFDITDTSRYYRVYVVLRHSNSYLYRNIWLNVGIRNPQDSMRTQSFDLPLATGEKWLGTGMDDIFERRVLLLPRPVKFNKTGSIEFTLQQQMRIDPLPHILQAGIRVEPVAE